VCPSLSRRWVVLAALCVAASSAGCSLTRTRGELERSPAEISARIFGGNAGLRSLRAVVEARFSYAGRDVTVPGVLLLDALEGFRLDLLDPLDRPLAMLFTDGPRIVQLRPSAGIAASLGVFPAACGVGPQDWVAGVIASSPAPRAGEVPAVHGLFGGDYALERSTAAKGRHSVRFKMENGEPVPLLFSWYCGDDAALQLRVREWVQVGTWRFPRVIEVKYLLAGFSVRMELREIEGNPALGGQPLQPRVSDTTRWTTWRLPQ
jgi:hypothetical protein